MLTWLKRIFYAEDGRTCAVRHAFLQLLFRHVGSAVRDADADLSIVEIPSIQFEEADQKSAKIQIRARRIQRGMELKRRVSWEVKRRKNLEVADCHEDETVGAHAAGEDFVEVALEEELFEDEHEFRQTRVLHHVSLRQNKAFLGSANRGNTWMSSALFTPFIMLKLMSTLISVRASCSLIMGTFDEGLRMD